MSPEYVSPYVKAQKNDDRDAEAIAEAATRPTMRFVELKSEAQIDIQTLHRVRDGLVGERTSDPQPLYRYLPAARTVNRFDISVRCGSQEFCKMLADTNSSGICELR